MARLFISHSSRNNAAAIALQRWIVDNGWDEAPFLDLDARNGIAGGERWERALHQAADRCEAVLFLISRDWLNSEWCQREFNLAQKLNKRLFGVLIEDLPLSDLPATLTGTWQVVNLAAGNDHILLRTETPDLSREEHVTFSRSGLARLKAGLDSAGLDPSFFAWPPDNDPERPPYPGLRPLEAADAGIFFGREAPLVIVLDLLRGLCEAAPGRLFVILGASGAGKSSFLRAGLWPRFDRDGLHFLPLPIVRPRGAVLSGDAGWIRCLHDACKAARLATNRADIEAAIKTGAAAVLPLLAQLVQTTRLPQELGGSVKPPALVLSIDQGEELFSAEGAQEALAFLAQLRELMLAASPAIIVLFTIRSDSYEKLQTAEVFEGLRQVTYALPPMPRGSYQSVITEPALRMHKAGRKLDIEPTLVQALLSDIEQDAAKDALPLLAFTLERLYREYGGDGDLRLSEYESLGRIGGAINAAVETAFKAADADPTIPRDREQRLALLRRALVPRLARIDRDTGQPLRRVARLSAIPAEAQGLVRCLVDVRLLTTDFSPALKEQTIEPAHETLLRQWQALRDWLQEDTAALRALDAVQSAAADWAANGRTDTWLIHQTGRLEDAERLRQRQDFASSFEAVDRAYLDACRVRENERLNEALAAQQRELEAQKRATRRNRIFAAVAGLFALAAVAAAFWGFREADIAEREAMRAEQRSAMLAANVARGFTSQGLLDEALLLLLQGARLFDDKSAPDEYRIGLTRALEKKSRSEVVRLFPGMQVFETEAALILVNPSTNDIFALKDSLTPKRIHAGAPSDKAVLKIGQGIQPNELVVVRKNLAIQVINVDSGAARTLATLSAPTLDQAGAGEPEIGPHGLVVHLIFTETGNYTDAKLQLLDLPTGRLLETRTPPLDGGRVEYLRQANGAIYAYSEGSTPPLFVLTADKGATTWKPARLDDGTLERLRFGHCDISGLAAFRPTIMEQMKSHSLGVVATFSCKRKGAELLLTTTDCGSGGCLRNDYVFGLPEEVDQKRTANLKDILSRLASESSSPNNLTWAGLGNGEGLIGALLNRDALVIDGNLRLLAYRHQTPPEAARFAGPDRLLVVEPESGQVVLHKFRAEPARYGAVSADAKAALAGPDKPFKTLHHGSCGGAGEATTDVLPDGRRLAYGGLLASNSRGGGRRSLRVAGDRDSFDLELGRGDDDWMPCVSFSADWKLMLVTGGDKLSIYDFERALASRQLAEARLGHIAGQIRSAFFIGASSSIVTADGSNRVLLWRRGEGDKDWKSSELYRGNTSVSYAEPDSTGSLLLLMETVGASEVIGSLYSVRANQTWLDLGFEYKWLSASFNDRQEIIVTKSDKREAWALPSLGELVEAARKQLSPWCRPPRDGEWRSSPCWPPSYD